MITFNEWFSSLPKERQEVLREDKWMLANAAFEHAQAERDSLSAQVEIMQGNFEHILHYWNRDNNQQAMENACWMAVNTSADMINLDKYNCLHDVKSNAITEFIKWATANVDPEFAEWQDFANTYATQLRTKK